jgi:hypothetical protein
MLAIRTAVLVWCLGATISASAQSRPISEQDALARAAQIVKADCVAPVECEFSSTRITGAWHIVVRFCLRDSKGQCGYRVGGGGHRILEIKDDGTHRHIVAA